jgi:hypothetical protein
MKSLLVAVAVAILSLAGCAPGESPVGQPPSTGATAAASPANGATESAPSEAPIVLAPGKAGPFTIGMTSDDALQQGLVRESGDDPCPRLAPVGQYSGLAVQFAGTDGGAVLLGVLVKEEGPRTAEGIGVGDSIAKLEETYGGQLKATTGEYGETSNVHTDGNKAIGFTEGDGDDAGKIFAIDVFQADSPVLWDGC